MRVFCQDPELAAVPPLGILDPEACVALGSLDLKVGTGSYRLVFEKPRHLWSGGGCLSKSIKPSFRRDFNALDRFFL